MIPVASMFAGELATAELAGMAKAVGVGVLAGSAAHLFNPITRPLGYAGNLALPSVIPSIEDLLKVYQCGGAELEEINKWAKMHGVDLLKDGPIARPNPIWGQVLKFIWPDLSLEQLFRMFRREQINIGGFKALMRRQGINVERDYDLLESLVRNPLQLQTAMQVYWRGGMALDEVKRDLADIGVTSIEQREAMIAATYLVPPPSDLMRYMVRDVFDEDTVAKLRLDTDFDKKFVGKARDWAKWQGITEEVAKANWRAHWIVPAPGQFGEMMHRLRPGRTQRFFDLGLRPEPVTAERAVAGMQIADHTPGFINEQLALTYHRFGDGQVADLYRRKQIPRNEAVELLRDNGYTLDDADKTVDTFDVPIGYRQIRLLFKRKLITVSEAADLYAVLGYSKEQSILLAELLRRDVHPTEIDGIERVSIGAIKEGLAIGALTADQANVLLVDYGLSPEERVAVINSVTVTNKLRRAKNVRSAIERNYLAGTWNTEQTKNALLQAGFTADSVADSISDWQLELQAGRRKLSAREIMSFVVEGIISPADANRYLVNLGYASSDIQAMLLQAAIKIEEHLLQSEERAAKAAAKAADAKRKAGVKGETPQRLATWVAEDRMPEPLARQRMTQLGIPGDDQTRYIDDARDKAAKK